MEWIQTDPLKPKQDLDGITKEPTNLLLGSVVNLRSNLPAFMVMEDQAAAEPTRRDERASESFMMSLSSEVKFS